MDFGAGAYGFGFLAGLLSTLSPCVLPIVPILLGSAAHAHPRAPLALAAGLALSYAVLGTTLAWAGASLGIDASVFRTIGAVVLGLLGVLLVSGTLQQRFALLASGIGSAGNGLMARLPADGLAGQFAIGLLLGVVWSPCVGPTLGAAIVLSSKNLTAQAGMGAMYELDAIAMAVIGGISLSGGRGSILGTVLGALIFGVIISGFTFLKLDAYYQEMVKGAIIVGAVVLDQWRQRRSAARL